MVGIQHAINIDMNAKIVTILCVLLYEYANSETISSHFLNAIHQVETGGRTNVLGDHGKALGPMQIHYSYWLDSRVAGRYSDCANYSYSCKVVTAYLNRYAPAAVKRREYETLARVHNGGPHGDRKDSTKKYWLRVKKFLTD